MANKNLDDRLTSFLLKLWKILEDESEKRSKIISWNEDGTSFYIHNNYAFCEEILPRYFKHKNMPSFVRQLNLYGFKKVASLDRSTQENLNDEIHFANPNFIKGRPNLLQSIKRNYSAQRRSYFNQSQTSSSQKSPPLYGQQENVVYYQPHSSAQHCRHVQPQQQRAPHSGESSRPSSVENAADIAHANEVGGYVEPEQCDDASMQSYSSSFVNEHAIVDGNERLFVMPETELDRIIEELDNLQLGQTTANTRMQKLESENEMLWNELALLKGVYNQQTNNVSRLLQFLVNLMQPNGTNANHHAKHHNHSHRFNSSTPKRCIPYLRLAATTNGNNAVEDGAASASGVVDENASGGCGEAVGGSEFVGRDAQIVESDLRLATTAAPFSHSSPNKTVDLLKCIQHDILAQAGQYSSMSALQLLPTSSVSSPTTPSNYSIRSRGTAENSAIVKYVLDDYSDLSTVSYNSAADSSRSNGATNAETISRPYSISRHTSLAPRKRIRKQDNSRVARHSNAASVSGNFAPYSGGSSVDFPPPTTTKASNALSGPRRIMANNNTNRRVWTTGAEDAFRSNPNINSVANANAFFFASSANNRQAPPMTPMRGHALQPRQHSMQLAALSSASQRRDECIAHVDMFLGSNSNNDGDTNEDYDDAEFAREMRNAAEMIETDSPLELAAFNELSDEQYDFALSGEHFF